MKVLDRYIIRELLSPIIYGCFTLIFLILIADLFDNLDALLKHNTPSKIIFQYYLSLIPHAYTEIIPWATWLATLFLLVSFGFHSETIAMKAAGLKITSIVKPILFSGFLIGIFTFLINDRVVPLTYKKANELREVYIEKKKEKNTGEVSKNVTYYSKGNELYYFREFDSRTNKVQGAVILWLNDTEKSRRKKMIAQRGKWENGNWEFQGVTEYQMDARGQILGEPRTYPKKRYGEITFSPDELTAASSESMYLNYKELKGWISKLEENGVLVHDERVDLQYRLASPWQSLVMMLICIPFLAKTTNRKAIAFQVLLCVAFIFCYHVSGAIFMALGKAGKIFPFASAWAANILFAAGALVTLDKANY